MSRTSRYLFALVLLALGLISFMPPPAGVLWGAAIVPLYQVPVALARGVRNSIGAALTQRRSLRERELYRRQVLAQEAELSRARSEIQRLAAAAAIRADHPNLPIMAAGQFGGFVCPPDLPRGGPSCVEGQATAFDLSAYTSRFYINRGARDGLAPDMVVLTPEGVAGRVDRVGTYASLVFGLSDPESAIGVTVERSGLSTVARGGVPGRLRLEQVPRDADIRIGDILVSSAQGGLFPSGLRVAEVVRVEEGPANALFRTVEARPLVLPGALDAVVVVGR